MEGRGGDTSDRDVETEKRCQSGSGAIIKTGHQMFPARIVVLSRVAPGSRRGLSFARAPLEGRAGVVRDVESALPLFGACVHGGVEGVENSTIVFQLSTGKASLHKGTGAVSYTHLTLPTRR